MSESKKANVELGIFELAYAKRACEHLAEAYSHMSPIDPQVDAAHKQMVTVLIKMSQKFSVKLKKLQESSK